MCSELWKPFFPGISKQLHVSVCYAKVARLSTQAQRKREVGKVQEALRSPSAPNPAASNACMRKEAGRYVFLFLSFCDRWRVLGDYGDHAQERHACGAV